VAINQEKLKAGREPLTFIEIDVDACANTYGVSPCTASEAAGGECYNRYKHCQDKPNYNKTIKTLRFCQSRANLPLEIDAIPCVIGKPNLAPQKLDPGKGLGHRATITVNLQDFPHHDRGVDPYVSTRTYDVNQGTYWLKFLARNHYLKGRIVRVRSGYLTTPFSWSNFDTHTYVIDQFDPQNDQVVLKAHDVLSLVSDSAKKYPDVTENVTLMNELLETESTQVELYNPDGFVVPASGQMRFGREVIAFGSRSGDTLQSITRGYHDTDIKKHKEGASGQLCVEFNDVNVIDVLQTLLLHVGILPSHIPYTDWAAEKSIWLSGYNLTRLISKPVSVKSLVKSITKTCLVNIWWHDASQNIKLKATAPTFLNIPVPVYTEETHFKGNSVKPKKLTNQQVTRLIIYYDQVDPTESDDPSNYNGHHLVLDPNVESQNEFNLVKTQVIYAPWFGSNGGLAITLGSRINSRYSEPPLSIEFQIDAKDRNLVLGDDIMIETKRVQDVTGANAQTRVQVISLREIVPGSVFSVVALQSTFNAFARYGFIAPNTVPDYSSATEEERQKYCFIGYDGADFFDDYEAYKIL